ncbi:hypothetical protein BT93_B0667 [Corymbia citriodora subsp. variegata]|nr:hypothetical protein BT93_B0667 [Corymbia citriodora subsp. variegata]
MEQPVGQSEAAVAVSEIGVDAGRSDGRRHHDPLDPRGSVSGHRPDKGKGRGATLILAYKTLGVVFGGLVTSPLYVYPSMPLSSPTEEDYLGIYSIMFWTLTLIGVVKYTGIALKADDQGEGQYATLIKFLILFGLYYIHFLQLLC